MSSLEIINGAIISPSVAGFDLDWTIVRPRSGFVAKNEHDWAFLPNVIKLLKQYQKSYTIAIFTNELYTGKKLSIMIRRVRNIVKSLNKNNIRPWVFMATKNQSMAKPKSRMFHELSKRMNINRGSSFYVGDMGGREHDITSIDSDFADNCSITFQRIEDIFPPVNYELVTNKQVMYLFVGMPGSGKTTYYERNLQSYGYAWANQEELGGITDVLRFVDISLADGQSVVIDCLNPTRDRRRRFLNIAKRYRVPSLIVHFVGNGLGWNNTRYSPVPMVAYDVYFKMYEEPSQKNDGVPVIEIWHI